MAAPTIRNQKRRTHPVDEVLPIGKLATYGLQHVVAFYAGAVLVPIIIAGAIDLPQQIWSSSSPRTCSPAASRRSSRPSDSGRSGYGCRCYKV